MFRLQQIIREPTRITSTSKSLIDHILCNNQDNIVQSRTISLGLSDHFLTFCTRKATRGVFNTHKTVKIRSLKHYSKEDFILKLKNADWNVFYNSTCVNTAWTYFKTIFLSSLDTVAPMKEIRLKDRTEPWMTAEILDLIKTRDEFLFKFKKHNLQDYKKYCKMRNKVLREISITKADFISNKVEENKFDSKKTLAATQVFGI